ncbi:hypothetical protein [Deinococcus pimensis]|uniref:hypothetical protein n=1 Tax=Deinococcus pimensis TaxID=309888 RepID=UPI00047FA70B|nr:hypothetical protein [Deinococcus pimensis]
MTVAVVALRPAPAPVVEPPGVSVTRKLPARATKAQVTRLPLSSLRPEDLSPSLVEFVRADTVPPTLVLVDGSRVVLNDFTRARLPASVRLLTEYRPPALSRAGGRAGARPSPTVVERPRIPVLPGAGGGRGGP